MISAEFYLLFSYGLICFLNLLVQDVFVVDILVTFLRGISPFLVLAVFMFGFKLFNYEKFQDDNNER